jgi:DNA adenine methylase
MKKHIGVGHTPRPFLKWAGGKGQLLPQLLERVAAAEPYRDYHEPFVGGGALYFALVRLGRLRRQAYLSDTNPNLIDAYLGVRDHVQQVIELLRQHQAHHAEAYYYTVRAQTPQSLPERSARIIYLNKTCYNGLFRENRKGQFNVPLGRYTNPTICDEVNLRAASEALQGAVLEVRPFDTVLDRTREGDFVYFDPPYHPLSRTSSFTAYSKDSFGEAQQRRLAAVFAELAGRGVKVLLSNSMTDLVRELYRGFAIDEVLASRAVNSKSGRRGKVSEALIQSARPGRAAVKGRTAGGGMARARRGRPAR